MSREREPALIDAFVARFVVEPSAPAPPRPSPHNASPESAFPPITPPHITMLQGATFAAKDSFDVAGWPTGCGNPTWAKTHAVPHTHAAAVERLLQAGARLLGKTCMDELAYSLEGRNHHAGAPQNPAAPDRLTGGSSCGAASAVAAGAVDVGLASDTAGSVRVPAAWCGLVGMRPTHARVSSAGLAPLAPSFDTVGWLTRSVTLARAVGDVLFGGGGTNPSGKNEKPSHYDISLAHDPALDDLAEHLQSGSLKRAFDRCAAQDLPVGELALGINFAACANALRILQGDEVWHTLGGWIEECRPQFGPAVAERIEFARQVTPDDVRDAAHMRAAIIARLDAALPPGRILCLPSVPGSAPRRDASSAELQLQRTRLFPLTAIASLTGRPQITLPLFEAHGAPAGFSLLGWRNGDEVLMHVAERIFTGASVTAHEVPPGWPRCS